jgi:hypothetical protein
MKLRDLIGEERAKFGFETGAKSIELPKKEVATEEKKSNKKIPKKLKGFSAIVTDIHKEKNGKK